jgi:predicted branched-subunit amino acid permease
MSNVVAQLVTAAGPDINSDGVVAWGVKNIIPIVLLVIGVAIIAGARKGQMSQNAMTITNVMLGCVVIAGAGLFFGFADNIATFVFSD